mmetsp:Transcript_58827/g.164266  ORF Transcript_58827/g.164266 Transcript_58827/m.164266 type:complete len:202 (-) Transcript_58827:17-622(-)
MKIRGTVRAPVILSRVSCMAFISSDDNWSSSHVWNLTPSASRTDLACAQYGHVDFEKTTTSCSSRRAPTRSVETFGAEEDVDAARRVTYDGEAPANSWQRATRMPGDLPGRLRNNRRRCRTAMKPPTAAADPITPATVFGEEAHAKPNADTMAEERLPAYPPHIDDARGPGRRKWGTPTPCIHHMVGPAGAIWAREAPSTT